MNSFFTKFLIAIFTFLFGLLSWSFLKCEELKTTRSESPDINAVRLLNNSEIPVTKTSYEKTIYTCRVGSEEIPALQIAEVRDFNGNFSGIVAHLDQPKKIDLMVSGAKPKWDYAAISAKSETGTIKIIHQPNKRLNGYNWVLLLQGKGINLTQQVKDCSEVSDE